MKILEAAENYLEAVLILREQQAEVRSVDVARQLGYARPTVSVMLRNLQSGGYLEIAEGGAVTLSASGEEIAAGIYERHRVVTELLVRLGVERETALRDACKIEHDLSEESFACIRDCYRRLNEQ